MQVLNRFHKLFNELFGDTDIATVQGLDVSGVSTIGELFPYRNYDEESSIYVNDRSTGILVEMLPIVGADENVVKTVTGLVADGLPKGCCVQIISWGSRYYGPILERWAAPRLARGGIHGEIARGRIKYLSGAAWRPLTQLTNIVLRHHRVLIAVGLPGAMTDARVDELLSIRQNLIGTLRGINVPAVNVEPSQLLGIIKEWIEPHEDDNRLEKPVDLIQATDPDTVAILEKDWADLRQRPVPDYLYQDEVEYDAEEPLQDQVGGPAARIQALADRLALAGGRYEARTYTITGRPKFWTQWMMERLIGHPINTFQSIRCPYRMTLAFRVLDQNSEKQHATMKAMKTMHDLEKGGAAYRPMLADEAKDYRFFSQKLEEGQKSLVVAQTVDLFARAEDFAQAERALKNLFGSQGWKIERERYLQLPMFLVGMPFSAAEGLMIDLADMKRTKKMVSWTVANIAPFQGEFLGGRTPQLLLTGRRGQLMCFSPFDNNAGNYNCSVVGKSGAGKSVALQELNEGVVACGGRARILDDGRSFESSIKLMGGEVIEFSSKSAPQINPFAMIDPGYFERDNEYAVDSLTFVGLVIRQMARSSGEVDDIEKGIIEEVVRAVWDTEGPAGTPEAVMRKLSEHRHAYAKDLAQMMASFGKTGTFGRYFNSGANIDLSNPLIGFELSEIKSRKELQSIVLMLCMFMVSDEMYRAPRDIIKSLTIDEAWDLLQGKASGAFIEGYVRRCRKYNGSLLTGTQGVDDYFKTPGAKACFENSDYFLLMAQKPESITALKNSGRIEMNERTEMLLKSVKTVAGEFAEIAIKGPEIFHVGRLILDPVAMATYSSKGPEFEEIQKAIRAGEPREKAIRRVADRIERQRRAA